MEWKKELKILFWLIAGFLLAYFLPVGSTRFDNAVMESLQLVKWYAREHVLLCLVPAFFIAGAIGVFVSQASVLKYLGPKANKMLAYGVASVSGTILAVCSCTVLPLFSGIYTMGAGLGPASAFLYSGPAINVLAIVMTARILGLEIGLARVIGAVSFSVVVGTLMHLIFRREENQKARDMEMAQVEEQRSRPLWQTTLFIFSMVAILVFANWGKSEDTTSFWHAIYTLKWQLTAAAAVLLAYALAKWLALGYLKVALSSLPVIVLAFLFPKQPLLAFSAGSLALAVLTAGSKGEGSEWFQSTWTFAKQILPLLLLGVMIAGLLLGRVGQEGIIPSQWISEAVGGNSLFANFFASLSGAFMYFATLTEVPILQGLIGSGMGKGPALALLLAGPALSLPSMLVLNSIMGTKKTVVFVSLVVVLATITGLIFGYFFS